VQPEPLDALVVARQLDAFREHVIQIGRPGRGRLGPRKIHQIPQDVADAGDLRQDRAQHFAIALLLLAGQQRLHQRRDRSQRIVDLVRDARGQRAGRRQLLGPHHRLIDLLEPGDVLGHLAAHDVEARGQHAQLVVRPERRFRAVISPRHVEGHFRQLAQRTRQDADDQQNQDHRGHGPRDGAEDHEFLPKLNNGFFAIDSYFSPIVQCSYDVQTLTSSSIKSDIIVFKLETDGQITPEEALNEAIGKNITALKYLSPDYKIKEDLNEEEEFDMFLDVQIKDITELSVRAKNCLLSNKIDYIRDLVTKTPEQLSTLSGFGEVSLKEVQEYLNTRGFQLGTKLHGSFK